VPEVVPERTHYGPVVDRVVERLRRNQRGTGDPDYDLVREHFDHYHAVLQLTKLEYRAAVADPIAGLLRQGAEPLFNPNYNFSMEKYLYRHPEHAEGREASPYLEWLKRGKDAGEIADPADGVEPLARILGLDPQEVVDKAVELRTDMMNRLRTGTLGEMMAKAVELEPLIGQAWRATSQPKQLPLRNESVIRGAAAIHACHDEAGLRPARILIVTDRPGGGGDGFDGILARTLSETIAADEIVVVYTDGGGPTPAGHFPAGVRTVDLASRLEGVELAAVREQTLVSLIRSFRADAVLNIESKLFYAALAPYGKALSTSERIFLCFFGDDRGPLGVWDGWSLRWVYPAFEDLGGIITESTRLRDRLIEHFQLSPAEQEMIHVFQAEARTDIPAAVRSEMPDRRPVVCWQASPKRQQGRAIAVELARRMPDVDFRLYGVVPGLRKGKIPANLTAIAAPVDIRKGGLAGVDAWLHTSRGDATANVLLDVAMAGVPIVAAEVSGVTDVLSDADGWLVHETDEVAAYAKAVREIIDDPAAAARRSSALRERLLAERPSSAAYVAGVLLRPEDVDDETKVNTR